jgi:hypothetical protein
LLKIIPNKYLTEEEKKIILKYEKNNHKINFRNEDSLKNTRFSRGQKALVIKLEENDDVKEICKKIDIIFEKEDSFEYYNYENEFNEYFKNNLGLIKEVYKYISKQNKDGKYILTSSLISTKIKIWIEKYKNKMDLTFYKDLIDVYNILDEEDKNSKINIGKLLDDN